jgi:hypothetical protein
MKKLFAVPGLIVLCIAVVGGQTFYGTTDLKTFRDGREKEFRNRTESPLLDTDFDEFKGLIPDADLVREAKEIQEVRRFEIQVGRSRVKAQRLSGRHGSVGKVSGIR